MTAAPDFSAMTVESVDCDEWIECWRCGGDGLIADECECNSFEDVCCCLVPEPPICDECRGKGGWNAAPSTRPAA